MVHSAKTVTSARLLDLSLDPVPDAVTVGGVDPGPKPGTCLLVIAGRDVASVVTGMDPQELLTADYLAVERYVLQPRSGRQQDKAAQTATLVMAEELASARRALRVDAKLVGRLQYLGPGNVKPWATDRRLERYGVLVKGGHHRDAVRHALYYAVAAGLLPRR